MRAPTFGTHWRPTATVGGARPEAAPTGPAPSPATEDAEGAPAADAAHADAAHADAAGRAQHGGRALMTRITSQPGARRAIGMTAALSATTWAVIAALAWLLHHQHRQVAFGSLTDLLGNTAAALAIILGVVGLVLFLVGAGRQTLWASWGVLLLGALTLGFARTSPLSATNARSSVLAFVGPATVPVALWMLARPLWPARLPQPMGRGAALLRGAAAIGALTALLQLSPEAAGVLGGTAGAFPHVGQMLGQAAMAVVWLALAAAYFVSESEPSRQAPNIGFAVLGIGMAEGRVALILSHSRQDIWLTGNEMLRLVGLFVALMVVVAKLQQLLSEDRSALVDSLIGMGVAERQRRARRIMQDALTHDMRSALFALDGAAHTLATHYDRLTPETRADLTRMLSTGVDNLRDVVDRQLEAVQIFDVYDVVLPVLREERRKMRAARSEIGKGVTVAGRPADTVAVLQTVLTLARVGSPGASAIRVAVARYGSSVEVSVAPEFDPSPDGERVVLQYRPVVPATPSESTFEMYVCARLMLEQGGELLHAVAFDREAYALRLPTEVPADAT